MEISREQFEAYVAVQKSGITNMWATDVVSEYSGLSRAEVMAVMKNYGALKKKYSGAIEEAEALIP